MIRPALQMIRSRLGVAALLMTVSGVAGGQAPKVFFACYVPESGTVYRIKEPGTPAACGVTAPKGKNGSPQPHVQFSWTDGAGSAASSDHGALGGLADDDHSQYALADGVRNATNGFAITGAVGVGSIPVNTPGTRMMWYPAKAAFRAGTGNFNSWDDQNFGLYSTAMGISPRASGEASVALGYTASAPGFAAVSLGNTYAGGSYSFAAVRGSAVGEHATAIGDAVHASADHSMALGSYAVADKLGSFVWGDGSSQQMVGAQVNNQFVARASHFWLGNNNNVTFSLGRFLETSTGAFLSSGGAWTNSSDSTRKTGFGDVDGEQVLAKLAAMPIRTWKYRDDSTARHMGPTAQDFRSAFALGSTDKAIATVDADGVSLAAIKALIARSAAQAALTTALQERIERLEALLKHR